MADVKYTNRIFFQNVIAGNIGEAEIAHARAMLAKLDDNTRLTAELAALLARAEAAEAKLEQARGLAACLIAETNVPVWARILQAYLPGLRTLAGKEGAGGI